MKFSDNYFLRYKNNPRIFEDTPKANLEAVVVIPCYDDSFVFNTLNSIEKALTNSSNSIEVIVIVNSGENAGSEIIEANREIFYRLNDLARSNKYRFKLLPAIFEDIPRKIAGVGYARKLGMDEVIRRFSDIDNPEGLIISLDADSLVSPDYFTNILKTSNINPDCGGFVFQYQHDFENKKYSVEIIRACKLYEIYLRYFRAALKLTGFPNYFHTIGSCFAVNAKSYVKIGGISRRQGGEDFYFLHKLAQMTKIGQVNKPIVFPSPRISDRVPFGTGPTVKNIIKTREYKVYNFELFFILQEFYKVFDNICSDEKYLRENIPTEILYFIGVDNLRNIIMECEKNSQERQKFIKRLYSKFDAFFVIKFLNSFDNNSEYPPIDIIEAASLLLTNYGIATKTTNLEKIYTDIFRLDLEL
jgi:hypothetical protein